VTHRYLPHTADIRVEIEGPTLDALFEDAADVLRELLAGSEPVVEREERRWTATGSDPGELLLSLLQELLYQHATDGFLPARVTVERLGATSATGHVFGEAFDPNRHEPQPEVKAVTRHGLIVEPGPVGWRAEIVFDV
jgi:protein archease